jgi:acyl carrier protein
MTELNLNNIESEVILAISKKLRLDPGLIRVDSKLADLKLDSLDLAELLFALEDRLKRTISIQQVDRFETVQDVINLILAQMKSSMKE